MKTDCEMQIAKCNLQNGSAAAIHFLVSFVFYNLQFAICNLQFAISLRDDGVGGI
jgi:hypothetical protein